MKAVVLVVDDEARNRALARAVLEDTCEVMEASSAKVAYETLEQHPVDLVLLDVMMPVEDGISACRRIKQRSQDTDTGFLPVIMLTALSDQSDRNACLSAGADDFLAKPFDAKELVLRTQAFLRLRNQDRLIRAQRDQLRRVGALKDDLFALLVHDLRNPLTSVVSMLQLLHEDAKDPQAREDAELGLVAARRLASVIEQLLHISTLEEGQIELHPRTVRGRAIAQEAIVSLVGAARERHVNLVAQGDADLFVDNELVRRALENLIGNAIRYAPPGTSVDVSVSDGGAHVTVSVADRGPGVPDDRKRTVFTKFGGLTLEGRMSRRGYGLGLYLVDLVAQAHHGTARVVDREGGGSRFEISFPRDEAARAAAARQATFDQLARDEAASARS